MMEITEERLAEIGEELSNWRRYAGSLNQGWIVGTCEDLVMEVRRLRKILDGEHHNPGAFDRMTDRAQTYETERDEARLLLKTAVSYLYCHEAEAVRAWTLEMNQLFVKWADEELKQMTPSTELEGEINVGDWFVWEPGVSSARELIEVTQVAVNTDGETWIESENKRGERYWSDEQRFREACTRTEPE